MSDFTYIKTFIYIVTSNLAESTATNILNQALCSQRALMADQFLEQYPRLKDGDNLEYFFESAHLRPREGNLLTGADYVDCPGSIRLMRFEHSWANLLLALSSCIVGDTKHVTDLSTVRKAYLVKKIDPTELDLSLFNIPCTSSWLTDFLRISPCGMSQNRRL